MRLGVLLFLVGCADARVDALVSHQSELEADVVRLQGEVTSLTERVTQLEAAGVRPPTRIERLQEQDADWVTGGGSVITIDAGLAPAAGEWKGYARFFDMGDGIILRRFRPGSPFSALGFMMNDRLVSVDGAPTEGLEIEDLAQTILTGPETEIEVLRDGQTVRWTIAVQ